MKFSSQELYVIAKSAISWTELTIFSVSSLYLPTAENLCFGSILGTDLLTLWGDKCKLKFNITPELIDIHQAKAFLSSLL